MWVEPTSVLPLCVCAVHCSHSLPSQGGWCSVLQTLASAYKALLTHLHLVHTLSFASWSSLDWSSDTIISRRSSLAPECFGPLCVLWSWLTDNKYLWTYTMDQEPKANSLHHISLRACQVPSLFCEILDARHVLRAQWKWADRRNRWMIEYLQRKGSHYLWESCWFVLIIGESQNLLIWSFSPPALVSEAV